LCYDRLARSVSHHEIALVQPRSSETPSSRLTIQLRDGTQQELHSQQLVWPMIANYETYRLDDAVQPVSVSNLQPGVHSLMIMKATAIQVRSVTPVKRVERASVIIRLTNHARYQIIVTQQQARAASTMVAIGARQRLTGNLRTGLLRTGSEYPDISPLNGATHASSSIGMRSPGYGDCVPAGLLVWTEGSLYAQPAGTLKQGDRLLCYDRLSTNICHVPLIEEPLVVPEEENRWVSILLTDGTQQDLTTSCRLTPRVPNRHTGVLEDSPKPITAGRLVPGAHSLVVIKTMPIPVTSISRTSGLHREVSLALKNPRRYDLLVCKNMHGGAMLAVSTQNAQSVMLQSLGRISSAASSGSLSSSSDDSGSGESIIIILGGVTTRKQDSPRRMTSSWSSRISLDSRNLLTRANLGSLGSLAHVQGECCVCMFHDRYERGRFGQPCKYGFLCDRCHETHARPEITDQAGPDEN